MQISLSKVCVTECVTHYSPEICLYGGRRAENSIAWTSSQLRWKMCPRNREFSTSRRHTKWTQSEDPLCWTCCRVTGYSPRSMHAHRLLCTCMSKAWLVSYYMRTWKDKGHERVAGLALSTYKELKMVKRFINFHLEWFELKLRFSREVRTCRVFMSESLTFPRKTKPK